MSAGTLNINQNGLNNNKVKNDFRDSKVFLQYVHHLLRINEARYIALFMVSGSIKNFSQFIVSIFIFSQYFFSIDFARWKSVGLPHVACIFVIHH